MFGRLPETIDPIALAEQGAALAGGLPLRTMPRLASIVGDPGEGMASVELVFTQTACGVRFLRAKINAELGLACQRCLQPMPVQVRSEPVLALFRAGESQAGVPDEAEVLVVEEVDWSLAMLVEDELLLAMPMMPRHNPQECQAAPLPPSKTVRTAAVFDRPNPFAVLEKLRKRH